MGWLLALALSAPATGENAPYQVRDIGQSSSGVESNPASLIDFNGTLYFAANDGGAYGRELWKSDGTAAGTVLVGDIRPGSDGSSPDSLTHLNGALFFAADGGLYGQELWALAADSDNDGLSDADELALGTDPFDPDSDDDGATDGAEIAAGSNPLDSGRYPVAFDFAPVVDAGNAADVTGFGAVADNVDTGKREVTNEQYVSFLNAVADTDTYGLFGAMPGIQRTGSSGSYVYSTVAGQEDQPVSFVSFYDALRFINWLHNDQPDGPQDATTTEDGAYTITPGQASPRTRSCETLIRISCCRPRTSGTRRPTTTRPATPISRTPRTARARSAAPRQARRRTPRTAATCLAIPPTSAATPPR
jgi:ELWxxDGT repeat protein